MSDEDPTPDPATDVGGQVDGILSAVGAGEALADLDHGGGSAAESAAGDGEGGRRGPSQATRLVDLARRSYRTVLGSDGKTYAVLLAGPNLALSLRGENGLRTGLARAYYEETRSAPGASELADALSVLAVDTDPNLSRCAWPGTAKTRCSTSDSPTSAASPSPRGNGT